MQAGHCTQWEDTQMRQGTVPMGGYTDEAGHVYQWEDTQMRQGIVPMGGYTDEAGHCTNGRIHR